MGYVYLILEINQSGQEQHKIGISKNEPTNRLKQLQTGNPNQISILHTYESKNYKKIENMLHKRYRTFKTLANNEWFSLNNDDVLNFTQICKKQDDMLILLEKNKNFI
jgi:hypothetical protein